MNVFVGPNNSGKSKLLAEIFHHCRNGVHAPGTVVLDALSFEAISDAEIDGAIAKIEKLPKAGEATADSHIYVGDHRARHHVPVKALRAAIKEPQKQRSQFCRWFLAQSTMMLDGRTRISLANHQGGGDLTESADTSLQMLFVDDEKRVEVRRIIADAFGAYFVVDPTHLGQLRVRLSSVPPATMKHERGLDRDAIEFHRASQLITDCSDGVKAFTGIIMEVIAGDPRVILIDEPEAFLHPSLAYKLGFELARAAGRANKRVFVSTHSPSFVMGCVQAGTPVNIVRLTYRNGTATSRLLAGRDLLAMMRHPLLRSANVLAALFYEFVVVAEADADRAFYNEVNERLLQFDFPRGIPTCLFLNAQNKQTVRTIVAPLRNLGIPVAGIVDVDIVKNGGSEWSGLLSSLNVPELSWQALAALRSAVKDAIDKTGADMKRDGGIEVLSGPEREAAENLFSQLAEYGLFVVPGGELESWLKELGAAGHGPSWLLAMFERMGDDPSDPGYTKPGDGDVWQFMSRVRAWFADSNRRGIPA
ncbi:MAG: AAA family ATPase [Pirellulales bacterium]